MKYICGFLELLVYVICRKNKLVHLEFSIWKILVKTRLNKNVKKKKNVVFFWLFARIQHQRQLTGFPILPYIMHLKPTVLGFCECPVAHAETMYMMSCTFIQTSHNSPSLAVTVWVSLEKWESKPHTRIHFLWWRRQRVAIHHFNSYELLKTGSSLNVSPKCFRFLVI